MSWLQSFFGSQNAVPTPRTRPDEYHGAGEAPLPLGVQNALSGVKTGGATANSAPNPPLSGIIQPPAVAWWNNNLQNDPDALTPAFGPGQAPDLGQRFRPMPPPAAAGVGSIPQAGGYAGGPMTGIQDRGGPGMGATGSVMAGRPATAPGATAGGVGGAGGGGMYPGHPSPQARPNELTVNAPSRPSWLPPDAWKGPDGAWYTGGDGNADGQSNLIRKVGNDGDKGPGSGLSGFMNGLSQPSAGGKVDIGSLFGKSGLFGGLFG